MVRLTDRPDMTLDDYRGRKTTIQQQQETKVSCHVHRQSILHPMTQLGVYETNNRIDMVYYSRSFRKSMYIKKTDKMGETVLFGM